MYFDWFNACTLSQRVPGPLETVPIIDIMHGKKVWIVLMVVGDDSGSAMGPNVM